MGNTFEIVQFTASTSSSTQNVTSSGIGTPVCALAFVSKATGVGLGSGSYAASVSIGASDGTTDKAACSHDEWNQAKTDTHRINYSSGSVIILDDNNGVDGVGTMSMITDGVQISWSTQPSIAAVGFIVMFLGDLTATVQWCSVSTSSATNYTHDTGTSADLVFLFSSSAGTEGTTANVHCGMSWGVWTGDTGGQRCFRWGEGDNQNESDDFARFETAAAYRNIYQSTTYGLGTVSSHANGFTLTANSQGSVDTFALSIKWTGGTAPNVQVGSFLTPTSTGTQSQSGMGFQPALVLGALSTVTTAASNRYSDEADTFAAFAFTGPTNAQTLLYAGDYGSLNSWGRSFITDESGDGTTSAPINGYNPNNGNLCADVDSMDTGGFTLDWVSVNGSSQFYAWYVAIEEVADEPPVFPAEAITAKRKRPVPYFRKKGWDLSHILENPPPPPAFQPETLRKPKKRDRRYFRPARRVDLGFLFAPPEEAVFPFESLKKPAARRDFRWTKPKPRTDPRLFQRPYPLSIFKRRPKRDIRWERIRRPRISPDILAELPAFETFPTEILGRARKRFEYPVRYPRKRLDPSNIPAPSAPPVFPYEILGRARKQFYYPVRYPTKRIDPTALPISPAPEFPLDILGRPRKLFVYPQVQPGKRLDPSLIPPPPPPPVFPDEILGRILRKAEKYYWRYEGRKTKRIELSWVPTPEPTFDVSVLPRYRKRYTYPWGRKTLRLDDKLLDLPLGVTACGTWSNEVAFGCCDEWILTLDGPSIDNPAVRIVVRFE